MLKLDKLDERLDGIDKILIKQEINLQQHMKRSESIEKHVDILEGKVLPVIEHVSNIKFLINIIKFVGIPTAVLWVGNFIKEFWKG